MSINLHQILALVGDLDDVKGEDSSRERFRRFLKQHLIELGAVRDYLEEGLRHSGRQFDRAMKDLINYLGHFLSFETTFGVYQRLAGSIDGHWRSPDRGIHVVLEFKFEEDDITQTSSLIDTIERMISDRTIPSWNQVLGLYIIKEPTAKTKQLEQAIVTLHRSDQIRVISMRSLLTLAEMMTEYEVNHNDVLTLLRPLHPSMDAVVDLMTRLVVHSKFSLISEKMTLEADQIQYWMTPIRSDGTETVEEVVSMLLGKARIFAFHEHTPGRKWIKPNDEICFYIAGKGVVAHAKVNSFPEKKPHRKVRHINNDPWIFRVSNVEIYLDRPVILNENLRRQLDAFRDADPVQPWSWFVHHTQKLSFHDFELLTHKREEA